MVFLLFQQALVQPLQLSGRKFAGVQIQRQHPVGDGHTHAGPGGLELLPAQPVGDEYLSHLTEPFQILGQKIVDRLLTA